MPLRDRKLLTKLVHAVGAWVYYEQLCQRQELFSEQYLTYPAGQFLQAEYGNKLRTEFIHPILGALRQGRGDKPRVDFVVVNDEDRPIVAVETKWLNSSPDLHAQTLQDLVRLALIERGY